MRRSSKGFKHRPRQTLAEGQLTESRQVIAQSLNDDSTIFDLPESKRTVNDITNFFMKIREGDNIQRLLPKEKRRYIVYLRKSTDDETKQIRSLEDQEVELSGFSSSNGRYNPRRRHY